MDPKELEKKLSDLQKGTDELLYSSIFRDTITDCPWLKSKSFSPSGAAANYSLLYILFRMLNDVKPSAILELGIGQTSKLTSQYVAYKNAKATLTLVEHDQAWIDLFQPQLPASNNIHLLHLAMVRLEYKGYQSYGYGELAANVRDQKFDLIICDGPYTSGRFARIGILDLIPQNLSSSFVIVVDDTHKMGGNDTAEEIAEKLQQAGIAFEAATYAGRKEQRVIFSSDLSLLKNL